MANADSPFGFRALNRFGGPYNGATRRAVIASGDSTATFIGDPVKLAGDSVDGYPTVVQAAAGDPVYGVVSGFDASPETSLEDQYRKASTQRFVSVIPAEEADFLVQEDAAGGALASTDVGLNANFVVGSGDTATGLSGVELDSSTAATTASLDLQIVGILDQEDNEIGTANQKVIVRFNDSQLKQGRTGV